MKNIWLLMKTNMRRNYIAIVIAVFSAIMLCVLQNALGNLSSDYKLSSIDIGVIDYDKSSLSGEFQQYLTVELKYDISDITDYEKLSTELIEKHISAIIEIPQGFYQAFAAGERKNITITTLDDFENAAFLEAYLNSYMQGIWILAQGAEGKPEVFDQLIKQDENKITITRSAAVEIDRREVSGQGGFIQAAGFFMMIIIAMNIILAFMILDDRLSGVLGRIQITPVKPVQYIIGSGIFGIITCLIEIGLFCSFLYLREIKIGVPIHMVILFMSLFTLVMVCFSIVIALAVKSRNAVVSIMIGFSTFGCILGGAYFPLDLAPQSLQNLARVLPQYWFMEAFRRIQQNAGANVLPNLFILALFSVLIFLIGAVLFTKNLKNR